MAAGALVAAQFTFGSTTTRPVRACVAKSGATRLAPTGHCRRGEKAIAWNQKGAGGARGPAGLSGDPGPSGAAGPDGAAGTPGPAGADGATGTKGARGSFSFDSFEGMPCENNSVPGTIHVSLGVGGQVTFTCV